MSEFIIAIHALVYLSHNSVSKSSEELSENLCTNPARIRKVMSKCKKAGLVETKAGVNGGYNISRPGKEINLKQVYEAINIPIVESKWHSGDTDACCMIASGMAQYTDELFGRLNDEVIKLLAFITIDNVEDRIKEIKLEKSKNTEA